MYLTLFLRAAHIVPRRLAWCGRRCGFSGGGKVRQGPLRKRWCVKHGNHQQTFTRNRSIMARNDDTPRVGCLWPKVVYSGEICLLILSKDRKLGNFNAKKLFHSRWDARFFHGLHEPELFGAYHSWDGLENIEINCVVQGGPPTSYTWSYNPMYKWFYQLVTRVITL